MHPFKISTLTVMIAASFVLVGCNASGSSDDTGGDGSDQGNEDNPSDTTESTQPLSGRVADGYLVGAKVCLDLNYNSACDVDEPTTTTTAGGQYTLDATAEQLEGGSLLVEVTTATVDEDDGETVVDPYSLTTPKGRESFVSPVTTLVARAMENDPTLDEGRAIKDMALTLGQEDPESLMDDFVASGSAGDESAQRLHSVAQVVAGSLGKARRKLEEDISAGGGDYASQSRAIEATLASAITRNLSTVASAAEGDDDAKAKLDNDVQASTTVEEVDRTADRQASTILSGSIIRSAFEQGFYALEFDPSEWCESAVFCFEIGSFGVMDGSDQMARSFTFNNFDGNGNLTEGDENRYGYEDDTGTVWVLNDNDQFTEALYDGVRFGYRVNPNGTISSDTFYLETKPADPESVWTYEDVLPVAAAVVTSTDTVNLRERDIAGESVLSVMRRMRSIEADSIESFATDFDPSWSFPAGSTSYWFTFPETTSQPYVRSYTNVTITDGTTSSNRSFSDLNELFTISGDDGLQVWAGTMDTDYFYRIQFDPSESGADSGSATLTRWEEDDNGDRIFDNSFEKSLSWERKTWYGQEAIVFNPATVHRYGIDHIALVEGLDDSVRWAEIDYPSGSEAFLMLNETAKDSLVGRMNDVFAAEALLQ